jgi:hypothetical protein
MTISTGIILQNVIWKKIGMPLNKFFFTRCQFEKDTPRKQLIDIAGQHLCQMRTADVVDVVYVNIVTWSVGCERVGELAKGGQLLADQGQKWMGIRTTSKEAGSQSNIRW